MNPGAGGTPGVAGIPADPGGKAGTGGSGVVPARIMIMRPNVVTIHPGILGDPIRPAAQAISTAPATAGSTRWPSSWSRSSGPP